MVIGDNVCIAILWLVDFHVGVFPGKLLAGINRLREDKFKIEDREEIKEKYNIKKLSFTVENKAFSTIN